MSNHRSRSRSRSPSRHRSPSPPLRSPRPLEEPYGVGFELEFTSITWDHSTIIPKWVKKKFRHFEDGGVIYKKDNLQITTEKSQQGDGFNIEAQMGVFYTFCLDDFNTSCENLKELLGDQKDENGKAQLTLSFHISKYPFIFLFYYQDIKFYKNLYDVLKEKTKDLGDNVFGFILYTSYYFIKLQEYKRPSLIVKQILSLQIKLKKITTHLDELVAEQQKSRTQERQQSITSLGQEQQMLIKHIKNLKESIQDKTYLFELPLIRQSIFKAYFPLKPRTNIYDLFLELSKDEQAKIMGFNFDILIDLDESIIWDMTPMKLFASLSATPANKIGGIELPLNEIFEFCKKRLKPKPWDQLVEEGGKKYYSTNFVNVGPKGFIAIEFRDFKKVAKLSGYADDYKDGLTIDEFQDRVGAIVDNFLIPFFRAQKSAFKYRKSLKKIPMKSKSKKSKTKERNKTCNRGSKSGQKTKR